MTIAIHRRVRSRRLAVAVVGALAAGTVLVASGPAGAVHDDNLFELGPTQAANILGDGIVANGPDWADIFDANGELIDGALGTFGGVAASFEADPNSAKGATDPTTFGGAGGSNKNNDALGPEDCVALGLPATCDSWHWDGGNNPAKDDLTNVYAYATFDVNDDLIIYSGFERIAPEGDSHIDIEFFQDPVDLAEDPPCNDPGPDATPCEFTGVRTIGDLIVSMDFVQGGGIGEVSVREWDGTEYVQVGLAAGEGCNGADTICAFNNGANIDGGPWPNFERGGAVITELPQNAFSEFGINVTELIGTTPCISTFMGKTRSSQSFTAELKDFSGPAGFNICGASIAIEPDAVNEVGQDHTFTVTVLQQLGATTSPAVGVVVDVTLTDANGAINDISSDTCAAPGTDANGECTVTFTSDTAGTVTGHASADVDVFGTIFHVETDGSGENSGDAVKRFVDAKISITPDDTNSVGESHTFDVVVEQDDGLAAAEGGDGVSGFGPAPDGTTPTVTLTDSGGAVSNIASNTCASPGTVSGTCSVTFTSNTAGTVTGHVSVTFSVGGVSLTRDTDETHGSTGDATKVFVAGSITWSKVDNAGNLQGGATFEVCRTHDFNTETELFDDIDPDVCVTVPDDTDGIAGPGPDEDPDPGEFLLSGLRLGRYTVDETVAPPGFEPDPDVVTVEITLDSPDAVIAEAFVNNRPIVKLTGFGYTNSPTGTPTAGIVSGTTVYTASIKNFGGASTALSGTLEASTDASSGTLSCPGSPVSLAEDPLDPGEEVTFTLTCTYDNLNDGAVVTADLNASYETNGLSREISGSPAQITFTIQAD